MRTHIVSLALLALFLHAQSAAGSEAIEDWVPASDLIFRGTIIQTGTSTIDMVDTANLAVVRVDEIFYAAQTLRWLGAQAITVKLIDPSTAKRGEQRTFFTRGWYFGSSVGVAEIGRAEAAVGEGAKKMSANIERAQMEHSDKQLKERLATADTVVAGRVVAIRKSDVPSKGVTEHDPEWREAEIQVERVLKGQVQANSVRLLFANSKDVVWYRAPKFSVGTEGVWLLRQFEFVGAKLKLPAVVDKDDFVLKAELGRVERLLR